MSNEQLDKLEKIKESLKDDFLKNQIQRKMDILKNKETVLKS